MKNINIAQEQHQRLGNAMAFLLVGLMIGGWFQLNAAVVLEDNFDAEPARLNYSGFSKWTVENGSVDTIQSGSYDINCHGGKGICLDMDGTTNNAGDLVSKLQLEAGVYRVSFWLSGNQQPSGYGPDTLTVKLGSFSRSITVNNPDPFKEYQYEVELKQDKQPLVFSHAGGDTGGAILDSVKVEFLRAVERPTPDLVKPGGPEKDIRRVGNKGSTFVIGDPVDTSTGELYFHEGPDLDWSDGPMPLLFSRYYSSRIGDLGSGLGPGWSHNYAWQFLVEENTASIISPEGKWYDFDREGEGWSAAPTAEVAFQLVSFDGGEWAFADPRENLIHVFDENESRRLVRIENGHGASLVLTYDAAARLERVTDGLGRAFDFEYNENGRLQAVTDLQRRVGFTYTAAGELASVADFFGRVTNYNYDEQFSGEGKLVSLIRPAGNRPINQTFIAEEGAFLGWVASQTDGVGNVTQLSYEESDSGLVASIVDPFQFFSDHQYNAAGAISSASDPRENFLVEEKRFSMANTERGLPSQLTDRLGATTAHTFDSESGLLESITHADGSVTRYEYETRLDRGLRRNDLVKSIHADGTEEVLEYDSNGNLAQVTDEAGFVAQWSYNSQGQVVRAVNTLGGERLFQYDASGRLVEESTERGNRIAYEYDELGRQVATTFADQSRLRFGYNQHNQLVSLEDENSGTVQVAYNNNLNLAGITNPLGEQTEFGYDANDRVNRITNPLGQSTSFSYDALGRLESVTDANTLRTVFSYDPWGRQTGVTDPLGNSWSYEYDLEGILSAIHNPLGGVTRYESNVMGRVTRIVSPAGFETAFGYDSAGNVVSIESPDSVGTVMDWDGVGNLVREAFSDGSGEVRYEHDGVGNIVRITDSAGEVWQSEYDLSGRLVRLTDPLGQSEVFEYDVRDRLERIEYPELGGHVELTYDPAGQVIAESDSDGRVISYRHDPAGRLLETEGVLRAYDAAGRLLESNGIAASYDAGGRLVGLTLSPGREVQYSYDEAGNLVSVTDWAGAVTRFDHNALGQLVSIFRPNGVSRSQNYDADSRIIEVIEENQFTLRLTRNGEGQIVAADREGTLAPALRKIDNRQVRFDAASQSTTDTHDSLGRRVASGTDQYRWDLASRLVEYRRGDHAVAAEYDARGFRLTRTTASGSQSYVWNDFLELPAISLEKLGDTIVRYYIHTLDGALLYAVDAETGSRYFYHFDELGNTRLITDDQGQEVVAYHHSPYGLLTAQRGTLEQPFTWQGEYGVMDEGGGLYYVRNRFYDAVSASFLSRDPAREIGLLSQSPYQYAFGNPLLWADLDGASPKPAKGATLRRSSAPKKTKTISQFTAREAAAKLKAIRRQIREQHQKIEMYKKDVDASKKVMKRLVNEVQGMLDLAAAAKKSGLGGKDKAESFYRRVAPWRNRHISEGLKVESLEKAQDVAGRKIEILRSAENQLKERLKRARNHLN